VSLSYTKCSAKLEKVKVSYFIRKNTIQSLKAFHQQSDFAVINYRYITECVFILLPQVTMFGHAHRQVPGPTSKGATQL
jgi:hypothetical protein